MSTPNHMDELLRSLVTKSVLIHRTSADQPQSTERAQCLLNNQYAEVNDSVSSELWETCSMVSKLLHLDINTADSSYDSFVDMFDKMLEHTDTFLFEAQTKKLKPSAPLTHTQQHMTHPNTPTISTSNVTSTSDNTYMQYGYKDIRRNLALPFRPYIRQKPNAIVPLATSITTGVMDKGMTSFPHPYMEELLKLPMKTDMWVRSQKKMYLPVNNTPLHMVEDLAMLEVLRADLMRQDAFAVDLEHHSDNSFIGIVCLMQISTRSADYIIDTMALWGHLHVLNDSFTNPNILKVFHGCNSDIIWLQRDLGLYVVNMFDTGVAAQLLKFQSFSLANLLDVYCSVKANKKFQMSDWSLRPLSVAKLEYARSDTHYLLYIYDCLSELLIQNSVGKTPEECAEYRANDIVIEGSRKYKHVEDVPVLLRAAFDRSRKLCMEVYENVYNIDLVSYEQARKNKLSELSSLPFQALYALRDRVCRQEDIGIGLFIPNAKLLSLSKSLPVTELAVKDIMTNNSKGQLRQHIDGILKITQKYADMSVEEKNALIEERKIALKLPSNANGNGNGNKTKQTTSAITNNGNTTNSHNNTTKKFANQDTLAQSVGWVDAKTKETEPNQEYYDAFMKVENKSKLAKLFDYKGPTKSANLSTIPNDVKPPKQKNMLQNNKPQKTKTNDQHTQILEQFANIDITTKNNKKDEDDVMEWDNNKVSTPQVGNVQGMMSPIKKDQEAPLSLKHAYKLSALGKTSKKV